MAWLNLKGIILPLLIILLLASSNLGTCNARKGKHRHRQRHSHHHPHGSEKSDSASKKHDTSPSHQPKPSPKPKPTMFNVVDLGAKGNGISDDTKAFEAAWTAACSEKEAGSSIVVVPPGYEFLVGPISFSGRNCQPADIVFQLDGTIIAPTGFEAWSSNHLRRWLEFTKLRNITIRGKGTIEGRGSVWWSSSSTTAAAQLLVPHKYYNHIWAERARKSRHHKKSKRHHKKPTALRLYGSYGVTLTGITIQNSPGCHVKFDRCDGVEVFNLAVSSPRDSPNTDGIHLQNSRNVLIHDTQLSCGDDCVSIQTGCSNINIHKVRCGPGHGISIGSLGRDNTKACVSNVTAQNVDLQGTLTGIRIKTWQGGSGSAQNIKFTNIQVSEVKTPIMIDQYYCDRHSCNNHSSAVALSNIFYESIKGTYTKQPVHLACSEKIPCTGISLTDIELAPTQDRHHIYDPFCWNAYGELHSPIFPPISCLDKRSPGDHLYVAPTLLSC